MNITELKAQLLTLGVTVDNGQVKKSDIQSALLKVEAASGQDLHKKYADIQALFRSYQEILKVAEKHPEDKDMKKTAEQAKVKIEKTAAEIKAGMEKLEKSGLDKNFKGFVSEIKEITKSFITAKIKDVSSVVKVEENVYRKTFAIRSYCCFSIEAKDATPIYINIWKDSTLDHLGGSGSIVGVMTADLVVDLKAPAWVGASARSFTSVNEFKTQIIGMAERNGYKVASSPEVDTRKKLKDIADRTIAVIGELSRKFGADAKHDKSKMAENSVTVDFSSDRVGGFFTSRPGVEDDDGPDFTAHDEIVKVLSGLFPGCKVSAWPHEKGWFSVKVTLQ